MYIYIIFGRKGNEKNKNTRKKGNKPNLFDFSFRSQINFIKKITREEKDIDINLRFILDKCNPIVLVPGIFSARLKIEVNCQKIFENEKENYKNIRFFCGGSSLCESNRIYKDTLFLSLTGSYGILGNNDVSKVEEFIK